ncbi:hypothetical protein [Lysobacter sp. CA199]|uniref:hypothetical protein n=1 Tax=Lysobacter sp. CA199 TaxID=3455608 RepID=UPI003F8CFD8D
MPPKIASVLFAALSLVPVYAARAGASLYVDDAATVASGRCQLESWLRAAAPSRESTLVPACDVAGSEFGLGLSDYAQPRAPAIAAFGAKRVLHTAASQRWALAASVGANWDPRHGAFDGWNFNLPLSVADTALRGQWHFNLGWNAPRHGRAAVTAGIGLEHALHADWSVLAELFADHRGGRVAQLGLRRGFGAGHSVDVLIGDRNDDRRSPWLTLGVNLLLPR